MEMVTGAKRTRIAEEEEEHHEDHISRLPDAVLGEIVSLLGSRHQGRRPYAGHRLPVAPHLELRRSAPLNLDLHDQPRIPLAQISSILSSHRGPGRRFSIPSGYFMFDAHPAATLDGWLRCPALDGLQELDLHYGSTASTWYARHEMLQVSRPLPPLPESVRRFSSTLHVASFGTCSFPDENGLHLPLLKQLSLMSVEISETSLYALLAGCPPLQSLMLTESIGCIKCIRIVSKTLRSIGVRFCWESISLDQLIIEDAPFLERFLFWGYRFCTEMVISVISAPKLKILGQLQCLQGPTLKFGNSSVFKGSSVVNSTTVLPSVKVLALAHINNLSLDEFIAIMKCFPCLENLYIRISTAYRQGTKSRVTNACHRKYQNLIGTLDIRLKKIVLSNYLGNRAHVNFATFFVLNAKVLESMVLGVDVINYHNKAWIEKQQALLQIEKRASRGARFDFVYHFGWPRPSHHMWYEQAHDLSTTDPFVGFDYWPTG